MPSYLRPLGLDPSSPAAAIRLAGELARQAQMLAFEDHFWITGWAAFLMLPAIAFLGRPQTGRQGPVAMAH